MWVHLMFSFECREMAAARSPGAGWYSEAAVNRAWVGREPSAAWAILTHQQLTLIASTRTWHLSYTPFSKVARKRNPAAIASLEVKGKGTDKPCL